MRRHQKKKGKKKKKSEKQKTCFHGHGPPALQGAEPRRPFKKSGVVLVAPFSEAKVASGRIPKFFYVPLVLMRTVHGGIRKNCIFQVKVNSGPVEEVPALFARGNLVFYINKLFRRNGDGSEWVFTANNACFLTPSIWTLSPSGADVESHPGCHATACGGHANLFVLSCG